jgi:hypothetical protein
MIRQRVQSGLNSVKAKIARLAPCRIKWSKPASCSPAARAS